MSTNIVGKVPTMALAIISLHGYLKLGFHIRGKRKWHALSGKNGKACKRTRVIPYRPTAVCPDTACDLSCGCEWLRMRQTESLHVAIHAAKGTKSDGGSWGIREYIMTSYLGVSFHSDKKRECRRMAKRMYVIRSLQVSVVLFV